MASFSSPKRASPVAQTEGIRPAWRAGFWCTAAALATLQAWAHRNEVSPDGLSYVEMAQAAARGDWSALVNGYWSPLYPFLLNVAFRILHPSMAWESTVVHAVNFLLYLVSLYCFGVVVREVVAARWTGEPEREWRPVSVQLFWGWSCLLFLWAAQVWLTTAMTTPDLIVAALVYLATALLLRIYRGQGNAVLFASLGAVLGFGFAAKAPLFLLAFVFLLCGFFLHGRAHGANGKALALSLLGLAVFALISAPLVYALSLQKRRVTFGDAGRWNYAQYMDRVPLYPYWDGEPPGYGTPAHPPRKVLSGPLLYEFAQPVGGSYPLWYDPSYWGEGVQPHFSWKGQLRVLLRTANDYLKLFSRTGALYVVFLALFLSLKVKKAGKWALQWRELGWVWAPSLAALGMYALVHVEQRLVSGFALLLLLWVLSSVRMSGQARLAWKGKVIAATILAPALAIAWAVAWDVHAIAVNRPSEAWRVADGLRVMGVHEKAQIGAIGLGRDVYWAHLAQVRIIAEIPATEQAEILGADLPKKQEILRKFVEAGAEAVVTKDPAIAGSMTGWEQIGTLPYFVWRPAR